jgi:hypothetical protein
MVKALNLVFDNEDWELLDKKRKELELDWRNFILLLVDYDPEKKGGD